MNRNIKNNEGAGCANELWPFIGGRWGKLEYPRRKKPKIIPAEDKVRLLIDFAFKASLSSQEGRSLRFRIAYCSPEELEKKDKVEKRNRPIKFDIPKVLKVPEIVQIAPAVDHRQLLIGVQPNKEGNGLEMWGLVDAGQAWWEFIRGERTSGYVLPDCLIISVISSGSMVISRGGDTLVSLEKGTVVLPMPGVFVEGPVGEYFKKICVEFHKDVCISLKQDKYDKEGHDEDYPHRFLREFIERILIRIRDRRHGGTILIVPKEWKINDSRLKDRIQIKYKVVAESVWQVLIDYLTLHNKFYGVLLPAWELESVDKKTFSELQIAEGEYEDTEDLVRDGANMLASLANIDGALVLSSKLCILGFGAEVMAQSPSLEKIIIAKSPKGITGEEREITDFGTRHRSAFRFCSSHEEALAFVVSQDGAVRVIKRVGADVVMWSDIIGEAAS